MADLNRIKVALAEKKISNKLLAEHLGRRVETISRWCTNKQQPSLEELNSIAEFLKVDIRNLLYPSDWSESNVEEFVAKK
ncbi:helix-turn-helix transcriptional regulator [Pedobacter jejuensis]|uniref:XRE family transcriptional regulator n=1 Tax=Pedobacter jejuensis TaxID=1268550 RepID=A0A3N0BUE7_9SPHI|nr:helix-turn-helix transcriptional regulator [Pedobacter jejuensis]RNL52777.1 XRE family transcriptional regulator [Pedobacter jejuensis]